MITVVAQSMGSRFQESFDSGNSASQQVQNLLAARFPQTAGTSADVVDLHHRTHPDTGQPRRPPTRWSAGSRPCRTSRRAAARSIPAVHQIAGSQRIAFAVVQFDQDAVHVPNAAVSKVIDVAESFDRPGYQVALGGGPIGKVITAAPGPSEGAGILAAMVIMLIAFGSVVAMGLPIMTALFGIAIGFALEDLLSHLLTSRSSRPRCWP